MEIRIESLVGIHTLKRVDRIFAKMDSETEYYSAGSFILDDNKYTVYENKCDGYRSMLEMIDEEPADHCDYQFETEVFCRMIEEKQDRVLEMIDMKNGRTILTVGTHNWKDYYPCFMFDYIPERMHQNMLQ